MQEPLLNWNETKDCLANLPLWLSCSHTNSPDFSPPGFQEPQIYSKASFQRNPMWPYQKVLHSQSSDLLCPGKLTAPITYLQLSLKYLGNHFCWEKSKTTGRIALHKVALPRHLQICSISQVGLGKESKAGEKAEFLPRKRFPAGSWLQRCSSPRLVRQTAHVSQGTSYTCREGNQFSSFYRYLRLSRCK